MWPPALIGWTAARTTCVAAQFDRALEQMFKQASEDVLFFFCVLDIYFYFFYGILVNTANKGSERTERCAGLMSRF